MNRKGFTLIELMIVVVIIGILAAIAIPRFANVSKAAKEAEAGPILKQIVTLQERHFQKNDAYAPNLASLEGAAFPVANAVYFSFAMTSTATNFCASATPNARGLQSNLGSFSMDETRTLFTTANCS